MCVCICICVFVCIYVNVCLFVCVCVCVCLLCMCVYVCNHPFGLVRFIFVAVVLVRSVSATVCHLFVVYGCAHCESIIYVEEDVIHMCCSVIFSRLQKQHHQLYYAQEEHEWRLWRKIHR